MPGSRPHGPSAQIRTASTLSDLGQAPRPGILPACAQFVSTAGRIVPNLRGEHYDDAERDTIGRGLARVRAASMSYGRCSMRDGSSRP
ncbi:DUF6192 family protein [Streptomyces sp. NPDC001307]|uniref:DUF6192 family protein n=1 Tax=Streptomyces sp. NPDC001307 TaxID=3364560 RepID=UPI00369D4C15